METRNVVFELRKNRLTTAPPTVYIMSLHLISITNTYTKVNI